MAEDRTLQIGIHCAGISTFPSIFLRSQHSKATNYSSSKQGKQWQGTYGQMVLQICFLSTDMMHSTKPSTVKVDEH